MGFDFAFSPSLALDPSIFTVTVNFVNYFYLTNNDGSQTRKKAKTPLKFGYCSDEGYGFNFTNQT